MRLRLDTKMIAKIFAIISLIPFHAIVARNSISIKRGKKHEIETNRPIIGVLAQSPVGMPFEKLGQSYIGASYIKYLESSGARVVPIMKELTEEEVEKLLLSINGVLFPGGDVNVTSSDYAKTGRKIFNFAKKLNDNGDYFPLWGTCLGFQFLSFLVSGTDQVLSQTDSQNLSLPLNFSSDYLNSTMFRDIAKDLANFLGSAATTFNAHDWSVTTTSFAQNEKLKDFFSILSTNRDRNGIKFVSTIEAKRYPFYGSQWHPEKNPFEWTLKENIPHEAKSIKVTQYMSNFFVNEARYSKHKFNTTEEEHSALIYNYCPVYTGDISNFEQCYMFKNSLQNDKTIVVIDA